MHSEPLLFRIMRRPRGFQGGSPFRLEEDPIRHKGISTLNKGNSTLPRDPGERLYTESNQRASDQLLAPFEPIPGRGDEGLGPSGVSHGGPSLSLGPDAKSSSSFRPRKVYRIPEGHLWWASESRKRSRGLCAASSVLPPASSSASHAHNEIKRKKLFLFSNYDFEKESLSSLNKNECVRVCTHLRVCFFERGSV